MSVSPDQKLERIGAIPILLGNERYEGPQPLLRDILKGESYPAGALGPLKEAVQAVHDKTQAPLAIAAQSAIAVASLAVQGFADVETLGGIAPCSLFCLTIAESGERKSSCDRLLMQAVRAYEAEAAEDYRVAYAKYDTDLKLWDTRRSRLIKEAAGVGDKAIKAGAALNELPPAPELPLSPNRIAADPTFEGLAKLFAIAHPSLGLFTDEAGGFFGGHAMNGENRLKTCAGLSGLWDGTPINRTRALDGASTLRGRRLSSHMMAQPVTARPILADPVANGQGFLARFLICEPESAIGFRTRRGYSSASDRAITAFGERLRTVLEIRPPVRGGTQNELEPRVLSLSEESRELLQQYYEATERAQAPNGEMAHIRAYASKSAEQAARIAGVMTLWSDLNEKQISPETMADAITLANFYLSEAQRLVDAAVVSTEVARAECLRKWLLEIWSEPEILPRDILRNGPNSLRESPRARAAITLLEKHGWLVRLPADEVIRGKTRKEAYRIVRDSDVV